MPVSAAPSLTIAELDPKNRSFIEAMVEVWNAAGGEEFAISLRLMEYNLRSPTHGIVQSWLALLDQTPIGFVVASHLAGGPANSLSTSGWIGAIAVDQDQQHGGIGAMLMRTAEGWLIERGVSRVMLGGDLRAFAPGIPLGMACDGFFTKLGYGKTVNSDNDGIVWDVATNLAHYTPPPSVVEVPGTVRPAQPGDERDLLNFMQREFPGRWHYETQEFIREGGRISDWMLLWTEQGVDGFCALTFEDSLRPIERYYPYKLPRPWGQLGPVGVSSSIRGQGFGAAVLDAGLRRLHNNGINGCVIDWTRLVDLYGKFGFEKYHAYQQMSKRVA